MESSTFLGPSQLFDRAWMVFEKKWKEGVLVLLPLFIFSFLWGMIDTINGEKPGTFALENPALTLLFYVALLFLNLWSELALMYVITAKDRVVGLIEAYKMTIKMVFPFIWVVLLALFIGVPGFLFFIIPGIIISVWFSFAQFVLFDQNTRGLDALLVSREYVRGRWWGVWGRFVLFMLVYVVLSMLVGAVEAQLSRIGLGLALVSGAASELVQLVLSFLATLYLFAMYQNLKELKGTSIPIASGTRKKFGALAILGGIIVALVVVGLISSMGKEPAEEMKPASEETNSMDERVMPTDAAGDPESYDSEDTNY